MSALLVIVSSVINSSSQAGAYIDILCLLKSEIRLMFNIRRNQSSLLANQNFTPDSNS